jgi:ABC-type multidrug transport system ATPase subunit
MAAIRVQGLTKRFEEVLAVDQLDFEIDQGTVAGFLGPTGPARPPPCGCGSAWPPPSSATPRSWSWTSRPTASTEGGHRLRGLIRGLADEGRTVLVSSHVLAEVAQTADQVVIIDRGRLVAQSTLAALTAGADRTVRVRTPQPEALRDLLVARGAQVTVDGPGQLVVAGATIEQVGQAAAAGGVVLHEMRFERSNLEDVFLELTGRKGDPS